MVAAIGIFVAMETFAELLVQCCWDGGVDIAYRKWGWTGGIAAFLTPFVVIGIMLWAVH